MQCKDDAVGFPLITRAINLFHRGKVSKGNIHLTCITIVCLIMIIIIIVTHTLSVSIDSLKKQIKNH